MYSKVINRFVDIVGALFFIILFSPILIIFSLLIWIWDRKSIFADNSKRVGKDGKEFLMFKFRSMIPDAHNIIQNDPKYSEMKKRWILAQKLPTSDDPRITVIGKVLRYLDIDELPQFFNVLIGNMSIVGPRPWFGEELKTVLSRHPQYKRKTYDHILKVKPGITGLWQVSGRNSNTVPQRFEYDLEYVKKKSLLFDLGIMIKTPFVILKKVLKGEEYAK